MQDLVVIEAPRDLVALPERERERTSPDRVWYCGNCNHWERVPGTRIGECHQRWRIDERGFIVLGKTDALNWCGVDYRQRTAGCGCGNHLHHQIDEILGCALKTGGRE